jgi:hypothetical protein
MNMEMELIGVDQKEYALGRHELSPTFHYGEQARLRDCVSRRTGFRDAASLKFQSPELNWGVGVLCSIQNYPKEMQRNIERI